MERQIYVSMINENDHNIGVLNLGVVSVHHEDIETECKLELELIKSLITKLAPIALESCYSNFKIVSIDVFSVTPVALEMKINVGTTINNSFEAVIFVNEVSVYSISDVPKD